MSKFTERVEQDLSQIADRATPSSTAWESIQHRIAEQTTEPTMEVIMLNPDQKKPSNISRTWLAVAAALVLVVGIGSLFAVFNQDDRNDIDTVDIPEVTVPLELDAEQEPDVIVPEDGNPDENTEVGASSDEPEAPLATTGDVVGDCEFGTLDLDATDANFTGSQNCVFRDADLVPFEASQDFVITTYTDPAFHDPTEYRYVPITGLSDSGFMYAGYMVTGEAGNNARIVGVAEGVGPYEGMLIRIVGRSFAADDGEVHMQWVAGDDLSPLKISGTDVVAEEVSGECEVIGFTEDNDGDPKTEQYTTQCDYSGNDSPLVMTTTNQELYFSGLGPFAQTVGDYRYALSPGDSVIGGLTQGGVDGIFFNVAIEEGSGELDGMLIHTLAIASAAEDGTVSGAEYRVALPPTE